MFNRLKLSVLRRVRARIALSIYEILRITARVLGDDAHSQGYLMDRATEIYANPARFEDFLRSLCQSENFSSFAIQNYGTPTQFVTFVFNFVLGRDPEPEALNAFAGALNNGELSYDAFCLEIMNSPEAKGRAEVAPKTIYLECLTAVSVVNGKANVDIGQIDKLAYEMAVGRLSPEDAFAEVQSTGPRSARGQVVSDSDLADIMRNIYLAGYNRPPTDREIAMWMERFKSGSATIRDFVRQLVESDEATAYRHRRAS